MNVNIYLEDSLARALAEQVARTGESRNALIRIAIRTWLESQRQSEWPKTVKQFQGIPDLKPFEAYRNELQPPKQDIFE